MSHTSTDALPFTDKIYRYGDHFRHYHSLTRFIDMATILHISTFLLFLQMTWCLEEHDKAILSQMQDWGKNIFKLIENKAKGQYLVAALLPDSALDKPMDMSGLLLGGCPTDPNKAEKLIECKTSAVILNKASEEIWKRSPWKNEPSLKDHPWHGEYRLLHAGIIDRLIENFQKDNGVDANCQVYLYSFYIPCADIIGCPYSCSDQVAAYNNRGEIKCKITIIGYTEVFRRSSQVKTNYERAESVLKAQFDLYQTTRGVKLVALEAVRSKINNPAKTFQELMYTCLFESPMSGCCVDDTDSRKNSKEVISYFVNNMVFQAVNDKEFKNRRYSQKTREDLAKYFINFLERQIGSDCRGCPNAKFNAFLIEFCSKTALDLAKGFGNPVERNDLSIPAWKLYQGGLKKLNQIDPKNFLNLKIVMCAQTSLSIDSLCTRTATTTILMKRQRPGSPHDEFFSKLSRTAD